MNKQNKFDFWLVTLWFLLIATVIIKYFVKF